MSLEIAYDKMILDKASSEPLHLQLSRELRRQLKALNPGTRVNLLSERKLSELLNLDRSTTHRAYSTLREEGLLELQKNRSLCVSETIRTQLSPPFPNIGIIIPRRFSEFIDENSQLPLNYLRGIMDSAAELNDSIMMLQLPPPSEPDALVEKYLHEVVGRLSGIVHLGCRGFKQDNTLERILDFTQVPQIFISGFPNRTHIGSVTADPVPGIQSLCEQLKEFHHKKIGIVCESTPLMTQSITGHFQYESCSRAKIACNVFKQYSFEIRDEWILTFCNSRAAILEQLIPLMNSKNLPSCFWCVNDQIALMLCSVLQEAGYSVPSQISVVGYDGVAQEAGSFLTTVKLPFYAIGCRAVSMLKEYYETGINQENRSVKLPTSLLMRQSLAPAGAATFGKEKAGYVSSENANKNKNGIVSQPNVKFP